MKCEHEQVNKFHEENYYGNAIDKLIFITKEGKAYVTNGEYCSEIKYCPFCGKKVGN